MSNKLSQRLQKIASMVKYLSMADIGTDHAHLPIYLLRQGRIEKALASDIAPGPLQRGRENAASSGFTHSIEFALAAGLKGVKIATYETCIIAGMGGENIKNILQEDLAIAKSFKQLILSPQRDVPALRRFLHENGFAILEEAMVFEGGKFYNIIDCKPSLQSSYNEKGYIFGQLLIEQKDPILGKFIRAEIDKITNLPLENLPKARREEMEEYLKLCREVLGCL